MYRSIISSRRIAQPLINSLSHQKMSSSAAQAFLDAAATRRSVYTIDDHASPVTPKEIESMVRKALDICPSPYNIRSSCCMILTGENHKYLFNKIVLPEMESSLPPEAFASLKERIEGLAAGLGTVLMFEDKSVWDKLVEKSPRSEGVVDPWSNVVNGMLQHTVWTALSVAGLGCSLQHYDWNAQVVQSARERFDIPESWQLKAELVFGHKYEEPGPIPHQPLANSEENRLLARF